MKKHLHYVKTGSGTETIILFHGFGQDHSVFDRLTSLLSKSFTTYSFDLYYHGASHRIDRPLQKSEWAQDFAEFLEKEQITSFSLIGFSLGGRFAIASAHEFKQKTNHLILLAPDGVFESPWYFIATRFPGNRLFKYLMHHPKAFDRWVKWLSKLGLVSKPMARFVHNELSQLEDRKRVYQTWTYFRSLQYRHSQLRNLIQEVPTFLILGAQDPLIPERKVLPKLQGIKELKTAILPVKHHQIINSSQDKISSFLNGELL